MTTDRRIASWVVKGALAAGAALLLYFVWRSLRWPLIHDAALFDLRKLLPPAAPSRSGTEVLSRAS